MVVVCGKDDEEEGNSRAEGGGALLDLFIHPLCSKNSNSRAVLFTSAQKNKL